MILAVTNLKYPFHAALPELGPIPVIRFECPAQPSWTRPGPGLVEPIKPETWALGALVQT